MLKLFFATWGSLFKTVFQTFLFSVKGLLMRKTGTSVGESWTRFGIIRDSDRTTSKIIYSSYLIASNESINSHHLYLRRLCFRVRSFDKPNEYIFMWVKSDQKRNYLLEIIFWAGPCTKEKWLYFIVTWHGCVRHSDWPRVISKPSKILHQR